MSQNGEWDSPVRPIGAEQIGAAEPQSAYPKPTSKAMADGLETPRGKLKLRKNVTEGRGAEVAAQYGESQLQVDHPTLAQLMAAEQIRSLQEQASTLAADDKVAEPKRAPEVELPHKKVILKKKIKVGEPERKDHE